MKSFSESPFVTGFLDWFHHRTDTPATRHSRNLSDLRKLRDRLQSAESRIKDLELGNKRLETALRELITESETEMTLNGHDPMPSRLSVAVTQAKKYLNS